MHLAINYSLAAAELVRSGRMEVDYFKAPNWDWIVSEARQFRPVAVHFTLEAGSDGLRKVDWQQISRLAQSTGTPYINLHLDAQQNAHPQFAVNTLEEDAVEAVYRVIHSDVLRAVEQFGAERVIVENSPYQGVEGGTMRLCIEPELISRLVGETGCGLLLDISHAIVTAKHLGINPKDYLCGLPVHRLKEMHFAGIHGDRDTGLLTDHLSIQEEDWGWLDWVLGRIRLGEWPHPWLLAFEYGGVGEPFAWRTDPQVMAEQVPLLRAHLERLAR